MVVRDLNRARRTSQAWQELASLASAMTTLSVSAEVAARRRDWDGFHDAAEELLNLAGRFRELRRRLLAAGRARCGQ